MGLETAPPDGAPAGTGEAAGKMREAHRGATAAVSDGWMAGGSFFGSIMAGTLLGWLADRWLDTDPWLVATGVIAGSVAGFYRMWDLIRTPTGKHSRPDPAPPAPRPVQSLPGPEMGETADA